MLSVTLLSIQFSPSIAGVGSGLLLNWEDAKNTWYREAFEDGGGQGLALKRIEQICIKLRKGKRPKSLQKSWKNLSRR